MLSNTQLFDSVLEEIKNGNDGISPNLLKAYTNNFHKAISGVLQSDNPGDKYFDLQQKMLLNTSKFAAYKAYHATQQIDRQRADADGVERTKEDFKTEARKVFNTFNRFQAAEYNTAVARSRSAKDWQKFADPKRTALYPNIKWLPSRSADKREAHILFYNKVWAKNDPFWNNNQPGSLWNCGCGWTDTDEPANGEDYNSVSAKGLEGNPGETGEIFTDKATYFSAAKGKWDEVDRYILALQDAAYYEQQIIDKATINIHPMHEMVEIAGNMNVAGNFINYKSEVKSIKLLPNLVGEAMNEKESVYPKLLLPRGAKNNADSIVNFKNGEQWLVDLKCMQGNGGKLLERLKKSYQQADYAVIKIQGNIDINQINKDADKFMKQHYKFKGIVIFDNKGKSIYERFN